MEERKTEGQPEKEPELRRPEEAIKDLEPEKEEGEAVKGGLTHKDTYLK